MDYTLRQSDGASRLFGQNPALVRWQRGERGREVCIGKSIALLLFWQFEPSLEFYGVEYSGRPFFLRLFTLPASAVFCRELAKKTDLHFEPTVHVCRENECFYSKTREIELKWERKNELAWINSGRKEPKSRSQQYSRIWCKDYTVCSSWWSDYNIGAYSHWIYCGCSAIRNN